MSTNNVHALTIALLFVTFSSVMAEQTTVILDETHAVDTFLYNNGPNDNFGASGMYYYDARDTVLDRARPMIKFDLASLPNGAVITSAKLQFCTLFYSYIDHLNGDLPVSHNFSLYQMLTPWVEMEATWNQASNGVPWNTAGLGSGTDYNSTPIDTVLISKSDEGIGIYKSWNITSIYQSWASGSVNNYGLLLLGPVGDPTKTMLQGDTTDGLLRVGNTEYASSTVRPHLVIDWTYHPGDANGDGMVNLADLQILGDNWQSTTAIWSQADFTGDGIVNLADLQIVGDNWGFGASSDLSFDEALAAVVVPEPATAILLGTGLLLLVRRGRLA
ncbi:MAG: DNRLRE domain-containing protein [Phycisphaeraceae bacterium]|nr:DNRLRE domain-containing protein [Phycisphaeraceae bacterium]